MMAYEYNRFPGVLHNTLAIIIAWASMDMLFFHFILLSWFQQQSRQSKVLHTSSTSLLIERFCYVICLYIIIIIIAYMNYCRIRDPDLDDKI